MKRLDIITNVGYIQESLEHSEWKGLNKEQTALEIKKIIDEVVKLVSKNESLHLVSKRFNVGDKVMITRCIHGHEFEIGDIVTVEYDEGDEVPYHCRKGNQTWYISEDEGNVC